MLANPDAEAEVVSTAPYLRGRAEKGTGKNWADGQPGEDFGPVSLDELPFYIRYLCLPWEGDYGRAILAADPAADNLAALRARFGTVPIVPVTRREFWDALSARLGAEILDRATWELARTQPQFSAHGVPTRGQTWIAGALLLGAALASALPMFAAGLFSPVLAFLSVANVAFRSLLVWVGGEERTWPGETSASDAEGDEELPVYSILVPLWHEAHMLPQIMAALDALDYPRHLLDIKLVLEADDRPTIAAAEIFADDPRIQIVKVPPGKPRTKPKAVNFAFAFVRGEYTVIYDAEDRPEADQLRKAVRAFRKAPADVACVQARLNVYNAQQNLLTRLFAADYALWFDYLLPGLDRAAVPMPLGGTSNHFRTGALRAIRGWDAFNVTEDADLGIRMARLGLRVRTFDSTTFEEAPARLSIWLPQRARWLKGYMQTWLVHMRRPGELVRHAGWRGFFGFQLFIGGTIAAALFNPVLWLILMLAHLNGQAGGDVAFAAILAGNLLFTYLLMLGLLRRGWLELAPAALAAPLYWLLISAAGYIALVDLVRRPSHWRKTAHGAGLPCG